MPIKTIAFELSQESATEIVNEQVLSKIDDLHKLIINKLESSHNYRTIDSQFHVVTSVLSNYEKFISVKTQGF
jgi:hypothetical protein